MLAHETGEAPRSVEKMQQAQANGPRTIAVPKPRCRALIITTASRRDQARASGQSKATGITASRVRVDLVMKRIIQFGM